MKKELYILVILLVILLVIIIILLICNNNKEKYTIIQNKNINIKIVFVCYKFDRYDYDFIIKWCNVLDFTVICNNAEIKADNLIEQLPDTIEKIYLKENNHDAGMWKWYVLNNQDFIKTLDMLILMNNSMLYNRIDMNEIIYLSDKYDMYGLCGYGGFTNSVINTFTGCFICSMMIVYNFNNLNVNDFINYWSELVVGNRKHAVNHEWNQILKYKEMGYNKFGIYTLLHHKPIVYSRIKTRVNPKDYKYAIKKCNIINPNKTDKENEKKYNDWLNMK